jgi:hypothetical protein
MTRSAPRLATVLLALALTSSGVALAATAAAPTLPGPIAPFGCFA